MQERLNKVLSKSGLCSRRKADILIQCGQVTVNGEVVKELGIKVSDTDEIKVNERKISKEEHIYVALNKPVGYVTTAKEQFNRPCVIDLVDVPQRVYPVGRLDMYSEGLILLTNDGEFMSNIIHPTKHVAKTYEVKLNKNVDEAHIECLRNGVDIGGYITQKAKVKKIAADALEIIISEGKNRQIRKMCEAVGYKVLKLKRTKIGKLELGTLKSGKYKILTEKEIAQIFA